MSASARARPVPLTADAVRWLARAALLALPTVLAFSSGGYFDRAREVALIVVWAIVAVAALVTARPLRGWPAIGAALALGVYAGWVWLSAGWAPQADRADAEMQLAVLYLGMLVASTALFRERAAARALEPGLALGALVVIGFGLAGRMLPGLITLHRDLTSGGRLDQPLTYWNATGALAAMGVVLCVRLAGDVTRPDGLRAAAAAATVPLAEGAYLSFSRGALGALLVGLVALVALAPRWPQLRAGAVSLAAAAIATAVCAALGGVASLSGTLATQERDGAVALAATLLAMAGAGAIVLALARGEQDGEWELGPLPIPRRVLAWAPALVIALSAVPVLAAASQASPNGTPVFGASASRLETAGSNRYDYWRVALRAFADHPLDGVGAGGFATEWLRYRTIDETVADAHSLELQTAAEEGLVGLLALGALFACVFVGALRAWRRDAVLAAGPIAALLVWTVHSAIDWDWEMPALTLVAFALAGALLARSSASGDAGGDARSTFSA